LLEVLSFHPQTAVANVDKLHLAHQVERVPARAPKL